MDILHYYDLEEDILEEYHIHRLSPEEKETAITIESRQPRKNLYNRKKRNEEYDY